MSKAIKRLNLIINFIRSNKLPNLDKILNYLSDNGYETSSRTVQRDFKCIKDDFGVLIQYNRLQDGYFIAEQDLMDSEVLFKLMDMVSATENIISSLDSAKELINFIQLDDNKGFKGYDYIVPLLKSIKKQKKVIILHKRFDKEEAIEYALSPYFIKEYNNRWYVIGTIKTKDSKTEQFRTFGLDRIEQLIPSLETFKRNPQENPKDYFEQTIGITYSNQEVEEVILQFTTHQANYITTLPWHPSQELIEETPEYSTFSLIIRPNYELVQKILSQGGTCKVIKPKWLQESLKKEIKKMSKLYK